MTAEFTTRWIRARRALTAEPVILAGVAAAASGTFPSWAAPIATRFAFSHRPTKYPELNTYPATPSGEVSHGKPQLQPEFITRYTRGRRLVTLEFAPVYPSIVLDSGQGFPAWQPPASLAIEFEIARVPLPSPDTGIAAPINPYPGWIPPPAHRFEFDRHHITVDIAPVSPAPPAPSAQGFPAWLDTEVLRRSFDIHALSTGFIAFPVPPAATAQGFPAWLDTEALRRDFDIRALTVNLDNYPEPPPPPPATAQGFPAWLENEALRRDFEIRALQTGLDQYTETPALLIFPKGSIIEQSFNMRTIEQLQQNRKIEAN